MNKFILVFIAFLFSSTLVISETRPLILVNLQKPEPPEKKVKWYTWEEAVKLQMENPKIIMVDLFTDWCGWCKRMDATTFENDTVAQYLNKYYYPVKFNAEQKEDINYGGKILKSRADLGRNPVHELAYAMVDGKLGYPCFIYFDGQMNRIMISPGYKEAKAVLLELKYNADGSYKTRNWDEYKASDGN
ncbi:MAG TPA: DUF255 domain-containing protein [Saprospiraceae bacterium]|nr:DUF255 domain-containing protein [Saprospiraceae bacterium]